MYDFHTHSHFSPDCKFKMEEMIQGAIKNKVNTLCITDHIDLDYGNCEEDFLFNYNDFFNEFTSLREKYSKDIKLIPGVEIGMQPQIINTIHDSVPIERFDFVIMSIHTAKREELHEGNFYKNKTAKQAFRDYYEDLFTCVNEFNDFDIVGHVNIIDRYTNFLENPSIEFSEYKDLVVKVLEKIISKGKGIEVNTSGTRYGLPYFHPNIKILKLYKELGGEIITFGSDAHTPQDIGYGYNEVMDLLKLIGFKYITTFEKREKSFIKI